MLALLLKLDQPDAQTLNQIMSLITSGGMPRNHNSLQSPPTQSATHTNY
jgi:hypothetical protein